MVRFLLALLAALPVLAIAVVTIEDAVESASLMSQNKFTVLLDVRRKDEWDAGHLPNATFIESLQTNTFEQLCINFANEKLQQCASPLPLDHPPPAALHQLCQ